MEYITRKFENTRAGLAKKDATTRELASQGYRITSEQIEQGHVKGEEQCCGALICLPLIFLAGRTPGTIVVTYGREADPAVLARALEDAAVLRDENKQIARDKTAQAQRSIDELSDVLLEAIKIDHKVDWKATARQYEIPKPAALPKKPVVADFEYRPFFLIRLIPSIHKKRSEAAQQRFLHAKTTWIKAKEEFDAETAKWESDKKKFDEAEAANSESKRKLYLSKDATALKEYWGTVVSRVKIPAGLRTNCIFTYLEDRRILVVDCGLPSFDSIPKLQDVRFVENENAFQEILFPRSWQDDFYERLIYNITLKTLYELFQSDSANALETVIFNGFVKHIDRAVGHEVKAYLVSARAMKQEFLAINLSQVDPKACIRRLKGNASERMSELVPIDLPASP